MGLYEVPLSVSLLGFGIGTMLANFHVWGIMFLLRAVLNILVRNASPRGPMCFRCLIFNLSGPCELLFLLCFIASWTWEVVSVMLYPCMLCVALLMCLFVLCVACLTVFVNVTTDINDFRFISWDTSRVSREEVCLPSFGRWTVCWNSCQSALGKILESRQKWWLRSQPLALIFRLLPC